MTRVPVGRLAVPDAHLQTGTAAYRQASGALSVAGFCAFAMLYVAQGTLPAVSHDFGVSPATASLTLSLTTLPLAVAVVVAATASERIGRRGVLVASLLAAAVCTLAAAASPNLATLLALRVLTGLALAGLPAVAMAYIAEEVEGRSLGRAMGLYISATGLGGMVGRLAGGLVSSVLSWQAAMALVGGVSLLAVLWVARRLAPSRHFQPQPETLGRGLRAAAGHLRDPVLLSLCTCGFVLMGAMVAYFNYLQYRLQAPPFGLSASLTAWVFVLYLAGTVSANWLGRLTERHNRRTVLLAGMGIMAVGVLVTLPDVLAITILGTAVVTFGFFGAHSVASGWVNGQAIDRRAQASALYLLFYHLGSSIVGFSGGLLFVGFGWPGVVALVGPLLGGGIVVALFLPSGRGMVPAAAREA